MNWSKRLVFHPLLFAIFPILSLYAYNQAEVSLTAIWRPLLISLLFCALLWLGSNYFIKNWRISAIITTWVLLWFFSYGKLRDYFSQVSVLSSSLGTHRILAPVCVLALILGIYLFLRRSYLDELLTRTFNLITLTTLLISLIQISTYAYKVYLVERDRAAQVAFDSESSGIKAAQELPDIYYIVLDEYSRDDILKSDFDFDNRYYLDRLRGMGFYIANCSLSNYGTTAFSLASSLNFDYLQSLGSQFVSGRGINDNNEISEVWQLLQHSKVRQDLERMGYQSVAFDTGVFWSNVSESDVFYKYNNYPYSSFEDLILNSTAVQILLDEVEDLNPEFRYLEWYNKQTYNLDKLLEATSLNSPKFVYAHLLIPHGPFVFGSNGEMHYGSGEQGYRDQVTFINTYILALVQQIITTSSTSPIIII